MKKRGSGSRESDRSEIQMAALGYKVRQAIWAEGGNNTDSFQEQVPASDANTVAPTTAAPTVDANSAAPTVDVTTQNMGNAFNNSNTKDIPADNTNLDGQVDTFSNSDFSFAPPSFAIPTSELGNSEVENVIATPELSNNKEMSVGNIEQNPVETQVPEQAVQTAPATASTDTAFDLSAPQAIVENAFEQPQQAPSFSTDTPVSDNAEINPSNTMVSPLPSEPQFTQEEPILTAPSFEMPEDTQAIFSAPEFAPSFDATTQTTTELEAQTTVNAEMEFSPSTYNLTTSFEQDTAFNNGIANLNNLIQQLNLEEEQLIASQINNTPQINR